MREASVQGNTVQWTRLLKQNTNCRLLLMKELYSSWNVPFHLKLSSSIISPNIYTARNLWGLNDTQMAGEYTCLSLVYIVPFCGFEVLKNVCSSHCDYCTCTCMLSLNCLAYCTCTSTIHYVLTKSKDLL